MFASSNRSSICDHSAVVPRSTSTCQLESLMRSTSVGLYFSAGLTLLRVKRPDQLQGRPGGKGFAWVGCQCAIGTRGCRVSHSANVARFGRVGLRDVIVPQLQALRASFHCIKTEVQIMSSDH